MHVTVSRSTTHGENMSGYLVPRVRARTPRSPLKELGRFASLPPRHSASTLHFPSREPQTRHRTRLPMLSTNHNFDSNRLSVLRRLTKSSKAKKQARKNSGIVHVVPRRKTMGQEKIERNADCVEVTIHKIKALSHLSQTDAAKELGLSVTALKHACRTLGYHKWPRDYQTSGTVSPAEISDHIPRASTKMPLSSIDVRQGPTVDVVMHPCDIAKWTTLDTQPWDIAKWTTFEPASSSQETESKTTKLLGNTVENSQRLMDQRSFVCFGLGLNPFVEEEHSSTEGCAKIDELQDYLFSMEQADLRHERDFVSGIVSDLDVDFGRHCFEHARLAKKHQLWSMA